MATPKGIALDKYLQPNGMYKTESGDEYEILEELVQFGFLKFCGCGMPAEAMEFVRSVLQTLVNRINGDWKSETEKLNAMFPSNGMRFFVFYMLEHLDLEEHGTSTPGWPTDHGYDILEALDLLAEERNGKPE